MSEATFFHLTTPGAWDDAQRSGRLVPPRFDEEGFVHCSTTEQLVGTIERHFAGVDDLRLLQLDPARLGDALRWEEARPGQVYPHVYRPLELDDVVTVVAWQRGADGSVELPPELR